MEDDEYHSDGGKKLIMAKSMHCPLQLHASMI